MAGFAVHHRVFCRCALRAGLRFLLGAMILTLVVDGPAQAQGWGFFGGFFGGRPQQVQPPPPYRRYYAPRRRVVAPRVRTPDARDMDSASLPKAPSVNASHFVVVIGDSLGQFLANGLDEALSDRPDVAVVHKARDSTGLVRQDFYDWPKVVTDLLADKEEAGKEPKADTDKPANAASSKDKAAAQDPTFGKIDVAVMMIGSNDRQSITERGKTFESDSDEWTAIYTRRAMAIAEAFKKRNVPLIWVGVPITKNDSFADDMAALNEIYRDVAAKTGATFVDTWEAFSNDEGDFSAFGPDVNGQTMRLRSADGIHFTKAGARKLATFVEGPIRRAIEQRSRPASVAPPAADAGKPDAPAGRAGLVPPAAKPEAGPIKVLTDPPVAESGRLNPSSGSPGLVDPLIETTLVKGEPQPPHPGRADDATWPPH